jgi:hypothetical protein
VLADNAHAMQVSHHGVVLPAHSDSMPPYAAMLMNVRLPGLMLRSPLTDVDSCTMYIIAGVGDSNCTTEYRLPPTAIRLMWSGSLLMSGMPVATAVAQPATPLAHVAKKAPAGAMALFWVFCTYGVAPGGHSAPLHTDVG